MAHITSLDRIDDDMDIMGQYRSTATCTGGVYVLHSLGWLLDWYCMRKQWDVTCRWQTWLRSALADVLGKDAADLAVAVAETIRDVQLYDGLEAGEYVTYYTLWGLDPHRLAPETIPLPNRVGPFAHYDENSRFVSLVRPGAEDTQGIYTGANLAPAEKRLRRLRDRLDQAETGIDSLEAGLPVGGERAFWEQHLIEPLRWTVAFLRSRTALSLSYCRYVAAQEQVRGCGDAAGVLAEGKDLVHEALSMADSYIRLRPGFSFGDYPQEVRQETIRRLLAGWSTLVEQPGACLELDLCQFLDRAEREA